MARTKRYVSEEEELRRWREGLDSALRRQRPKRRWFRGVTLVALVAIASVAGTAAYMWQDIQGLMTRTDVNLEPLPEGAINVLMIGSDSREGISDPEDVVKFGSVSGRRSDTIILAQIVPSEKRGVLLHFPRDLWVQVPASDGFRSRNAKINTTYEQGPQAVIDTIQNLTGIPINNYMEIDINGFRSMVDAIGGIDVCLDESLYDSKLRFRLPAGHNHLGGEEALSFVRARHATSDGDFGRIRRQQLFLKAVVQKVGRPTVLGNPVRLNHLARAFASNVTVDQHFNLDDMLRFALQVKRVGPDQLTMKTVPGRIGRAGGQSVVIMDDDEAEELFADLRDIRDPDATPIPEPGFEEEPSEPAAPQETGEPEPAGLCA